MPNETPLRALSVVLAVLLWISPSMLVAQSPSFMSFQGFLTDTAGAGLNDTLDIRFALYTDAVTSTFVWNETQTVIVSGGVFNAMLGTLTAIPDSVFDTPEVFLGIKVESDEEMTPRQPIGSVGYAFRSNCALSVWYADTDGDGYGDDSNTTVSCTQPAGFIADNSDCNDGMAAINPAASEICNNLDDDCNFTIDDGSASDECDDLNVCTIDSCSGGACTNTGDTGAPCSDGNFCTIDDQCNAGGSCAPGTPKNCDDGQFCTADSCDPGSGNCTYSPSTGCLIKGTCYAHEQNNPENDCQWCVEVNTSWIDKVAGSACGAGGAGLCNGSGACIE